jgi:hypothetical protein
MCDDAEYCFSCSMQGIYFYDITTLLLNTEAFHNVIDMLVERYEGRNVEAVAGMACKVAAVHAPPNTVSMARSHRKGEGNKQMNPDVQASRRGGLSLGRHLRSG